MSEAVMSDAADFTRLIVSFYEEAVLDEKATRGWSEETFDYAKQEWRQIRHPGAGRDIFRDTTFIEIRIPGNLKEIRRREVREDDKIKFAREWLAYQATKQNPVIGTPLETLPTGVMSKAQALEWKGMGFQTAEQIRNCSDSDGQKFMGFQDVKRRVSNYLAGVEGHAPIGRLESELEARDREIAALRAQVQEMAKPKKKAD